MDWELYERYRGTLLFIALVFFSVLLLLFHATTPVQKIQTILL